MRKVRIRSIMEIHACIKDLEEGQFDEVLTTLYGKEA